MKRTRLLSLLLIVVLAVGVLAGCNNKKETGYVFDPADVVAHKSYTSVYDEIGSKITADTVLLTLPTKA